MTKEIYHEGWLIKSPPKKRIWRAVSTINILFDIRWRRRWFTLKQGEIPEQFCLEYYTDRNCRKLKGVIDLDQCEQVDSGLQLEHRKQKFQHMFDVKTPRRTYYLAADSEEDMNAWVNRICEVCNLQDLSKPQTQNINDNRQYYNVNTEIVEDQPIPSTSSSVIPSKQTHSIQNASDQVALLTTVEPIDNNNSVYQNFVPNNRNSSYTNRETIICDISLSQNASTTKDLRKTPQTNVNDFKEHYYNFTVASNPTLSDGLSISNKENDTSVAHINNDDSRMTATNATVSRKIPENLKLNSNISSETIGYTPSVSLNTSSGPYIAISECISGNPIIDRDNPTTPLNSLDPKFYDTPRSHFNIGLNLTNDQPYSPKRNNLSAIQQQLPRSGRPSPTDSESVFTDDEEWLASNPNDSANGDRSMRPSKSSVENDQIVFTYAQRFSKLPEDENSAQKTKSHSKRSNPVFGLCLEKNESEDQNKEINSSDTENASPAIAYGPKDINSCVDESYDIPRSHQLPYMKRGDGNDESSSSSTLNRTSMDTSKLDECRSANKISPNSDLNIHSATLPARRPHYYTNAAPTKIEGNVFRYDFDEKSDAPVVDRRLKPKLQTDESNKSQSNQQLSNGQSSELKPPCIDRKLKPTTPIKLETSTLQRRPTPNESVHFRSNSEQFSRTLPRYNNSASLSGMSTSPLSTQLIQTVTTKPNGVLEYFDLDHSNPPPICNSINTSASTSNLSANTVYNFTGSNSTTNLSHRFSTLGISTPSIHGAQNHKNDPISAASTTNIGTAASIVGQPSGIVYKKVDFIKTEAFMRTRQDAELARAKNRSKE